MILTPPMFQLFRTDLVDGFVGGTRTGGSRRRHPRSAVRETSQPAVLSDCRNELPNVSVNPCCRMGAESY